MNHPYEMSRRFRWTDKSGVPWVLVLTPHPFGHEARKDVYGTKWPRAAACLEKDRAELLAFYDFPAEHWQHLRTSNPIESTFATVRLRTCRTKGPGSRAAVFVDGVRIAA